MMHEPDVINTPDKLTKNVPTDRLHSNSALVMKEIANLLLKKLNYTVALE